MRGEGVKEGAWMLTLGRGKEINQRTYFIDVCWWGWGTEGGWRCSQPV